MYIRESYMTSKNRTLSMHLLRCLMRRPAGYVDGRFPFHTLPLTVLASGCERRVKVEVYRKERRRDELTPMDDRHRLSFDHYQTENKRV